MSRQSVQRRLPYNGKMGPDEFVAVAAAFLGAKVRAVSLEGCLWYALVDLLPRQCRSKKGGASSSTKKFINRNAPTGHRVVQLKGVRRHEGWYPTCVVSQAALTVVLTYVRHRSQGKSFASSWVRLPDPLKIPVINRKAA